MDRHLLGLRLLAEEAGGSIPKIFKSDGFNKMQRYGLLTSPVILNPFLIKKIYA